MWSNGGIITIRGKLEENVEKNLLQCPSVHHESLLKSPKD
jgi:hypothetical protein